MEKSELVQVYDETLSKFYFNKDRKRVIAVAEAQYKSGNVVLVLTNNCLVIHYNGSEWVQYYGDRPRKLQEFIHLTNIDGIEIRKNNTLLLHSYLYPKWKELFVLYNDPTDLLGHLPYLHNLAKTEEKNKKIAKLQKEIKELES